MEILFPGGVGRTYSPAEASGILEFDLELVRRLREASGLSEQMVDEEDLEMLKKAKAALDAGFPEEALLQATRVYAETMGRVAEAKVRLVHFYVHERLKAAGLSGLGLQNAGLAASAQLQPMTEPTMLYFHRKGMVRAVREDMVMSRVHRRGTVTAARKGGQP